MKKVAIGLFVLQGLALIGKLLSGDGFTFGKGALFGVAELIGYFLPAIIGIVLLIVSNKK